MTANQPPPGVKREDRPTHIWEYVGPGASRGYQHLRLQQFGQKTSATAEGGRAQGFRPPLLGLL